MPRPHRIIAPGIAHHITQRGNYRQNVFFRNEDRRFYLTLVKDFLPHFGVTLQAYCLMSNHVHLLATPHDCNGLSRALQRVHSEYARALHMRLRRTGHLWQARFHSVALDEKHFWAAMVYIEQNPVRAGLATNAAEWPWSSAQAHLGRVPNTLLDLVPWRSRFDANRWNEWLTGESLDAEAADRIRAATLCGFPLGSSEFRRDLEMRFGLPTEPRPPGRPKKALCNEKLAIAAA